VCVCVCVYVCVCVCVVCVCVVGSIKSRTSVLCVFLLFNDRYTIAKIISRQSKESSSKQCTHKCQWVILITNININTYKVKVKDMIFLTCVCVCVCC